MPIEHAVAGDGADLDALACILGHRCSAPHAPYRVALGLEPDELAAMLRRCFPDRAANWHPGACAAPLFAVADVAHGCPQSGSDDDPGYGRFSRSLEQQEEADLCQLLLDHRADDTFWPLLFARLVARACMESDHLWMCLGLRERGQLSGILARHFPALAARNTHNMRWKRFFYKLLCDTDKVWACAARTCTACPHRVDCYVP